MVTPVCAGVSFDVADSGVVAMTPVRGGGGVGCTGGRSSVGISKAPAWPFILQLVQILAQTL